MSEQNIDKQDMYPIREITIKMMILITIDILVKFFIFVRLDLLNSFFIINSRLCESKQNKVVDIAKRDD